MNDRFKFRLWDKENKTYYVSPYGSFSLSDSGELFWIESNCDCSELNTSDYVVEQCTGINDANGKLVFEGDIVKTKHDDVGVVIYSDHFLEWRIIFKKGRKHLLDNEEFGVPMFDFTENAIGKNILKVIGNIHENPELLK